MPKQSTNSDFANAIRALSMDAVQEAGCGHPGMPMGMAEIAQALWMNHLSHNPKNPNWLNRDRFVLSNGHGSMLLYSLLHLTGYELSISDLKNFRQLHSKTPGHPEIGYAPGVETTTGPLGQGIANAVGMALAEKILATKYNKDNFQIFDHKTYAFVGDGDLMEGISHEACSLAGTLELGNLIVFYDDNEISIDGRVDSWFTDDTKKRFESYGWEVFGNVDGHDVNKINSCIEKAKKSTKPTLICCKTVIGKGSPNKSGTSEVHGAALGDEEIELTREEIGWKYPPFEVPDHVYEAWNNEKYGQAQEDDWNSMFDDYSKNYSKEHSEIQRIFSSSLPGELDKIFEDLIENFSNDETHHASRKASGMCLDSLGPRIPELFGGSADLSPSNNTQWKGSELLENGIGNYLSYGVREFGMSAIMNGLYLHGGFRPYGGTFLTFLDYARNAVRMSALMKLPIIYVYTHDSIGVGEDGPTHQPVEHLTILRSTPNLNTWRPCDGVETAYSWKAALTSQDKPSALILSRQNLEPQKRDDHSQIAKGGYLLSQEEQSDLTIMATGSEVQLAMHAKEYLRENGLKANVVSMPCTEIFDQQDDEYKTNILGDGPRVAIECGYPDFWHKYLNQGDLVIGMESFGESAPGSVLMDHFGFTADKVSKKIISFLKK